MAEATIFSIASKLLSTIASPAFTMAYEKGLSIWEAKNELDKLRTRIQSIQAMLLDAEKKQESSSSVKEWVKRVREVMYDADDLFDEVVTNDLLKQKIIKRDDNNLFLKKVRVSCSKLNPIISRNSIANKVKAIQKTLMEISNDMTQFQFVRCDIEEESLSGMRRGQDREGVVDLKNVCGRDNDKKAILEILLNESSSVIAIVGIGGMGKTTLAQLVSRDVEVQKKYEKIWFACISDTKDDREVLGKIFHSISGKNYSSFTVPQLESMINESIMGTKDFLLVLDDVWDAHHGRWQARMSLLKGGAKGSKIIVTTRSPSVANAVGATKTHKLDGLPEDDSWDLFRRVAFAPENENDPRRIDLGREIIKKCRNVPLAIKSIGSLLFEKNTIQEWESFRNEDLPKLGESHDDGIMPVLKLSYDHLSSSMKQCFAYCSLFPKDDIIIKQKLIYLWIAQGYIRSNNEKQTIEEVGHLYFMDLLRRGFFEKVGEGDLDVRYKMHDLIHDLAQHVAREESFMLTKSSNKPNCTRHVSVSDSIDDTWALSSQLLNLNQLRSFMFLNGGSICTLALDQVLANFKVLRALSLSKLRIKNVSSSIGDLKHLRYLDLSWNYFETLPNSMTNLVNLLTLDLTCCANLKALPDNFGDLISLRCLHITFCSSLKHMPPRIGEMTCLQYLSDFKVGKASDGVKGSELNALNGLQQLRGHLEIQFDYEVEYESWKLPVSLDGLGIRGYPGMRIPHWTSYHPSFQPSLASLNLYECLKVKYLPPLRHLPNLRSLYIVRLKELEYVEEDDDTWSINSSFFPRLEILELQYLPKLKRWWRTTTTTTTTDQPQQQQQFVSLSRLQIDECPELKSIPLCSPRTRILKLYDVDVEVQQLMLINSGGPNDVGGPHVRMHTHASQTQHINPMSIWSKSSSTSSLSSLEEISILKCKGLTSFTDEALTSLRRFTIGGCGSLKNLNLTSPNLQKIMISDCNELMSLQVEAFLPLQSLIIHSCEQLKSLDIEFLDVLEELKIIDCPELELWEEDINWDSFSTLRCLNVDLLPLPWKLPHLLQDRQALGKLDIFSGANKSTWEEITAEMIAEKIMREMM